MREYKAPLAQVINFDHDYVATDKKTYASGTCSGNVQWTGKDCSKGLPSGKDS